MNKLFTIILSLGLVLGAASVARAARHHHKHEHELGLSNKPQVLTLEKKNTLTFRLVVTEDSVKDLQQKLLEMSSKLSKEDVIYLYLDTPGGDVTAGMNMVASLKAVPQEVKTITSFATSMGFITVQNLGERLITPNGTLMAHRARGGAQGQIRGELNSRVDFTTDYIEEIEKDVASRMGITHEAYQKLAKDEYWVSGKKAVEQHAADKVVLINCDKDLTGTTTETINTFFGPVMVEWADCPTIAAPVKVSFSNMTDNLNGNEYEAEKARRVIYEGITNKLSFSNDDFLQETYLKFVK